MRGVAAYISEETDGSIRLIFDDVKSIDDSQTPDWQYQALFTSNSYGAESLKSLSLSKEQFAEIGENLVVRLLALDGYLK